MKYSVLLLYPDYLNEDGTETYFCHVEGNSIADAVEAAQIEAAEANNCPPAEADDFAELITFPGHIEACPVVEIDKDSTGYETAAAAQAGASLPVEELRPDLARIANTANDFLPAEDPERDSMGNLAGNGYAPRDPADLAQEIAADRQGLIDAGRAVIDAWATGDLAEAVNRLRETIEHAEATEGA